MKDKLKALLPKAVVTKTVCGVTAAAALTTGAVVGVSAYQSGNVFHPSGTERDFRANQVHFSDDKDVKGSDSSAENNDSEYWEKDQNADDTENPQGNDGADYMFDREQVQQSAQQDQQVQQLVNSPISLIDGSMVGSANLPNSGVVSGSSDAIFGVTTDRDNADIVIGGGKPGGTVTVPGNNGGNNGIGGTESGGNTGGTTPSDPGETGGSEQPTTPSNPTTPTQPSRPSGGNENNGGSVTPTPTPTPDPEPTPEPTTPSKTDTAVIDKPDKQPEVGPSDGWGPSTGIYDEDDVNLDPPTTDSDGNVKSKWRFSMFFTTDTQYSLYCGQTLDYKTLCESIDAFVSDSTTMTNYYLTTQDFGEDGYLNITGISFNDGEDIISIEDLPITIPDAEDITVYGYYRLKKSDPWTELNPDSDKVYESIMNNSPLDSQRIYVLNRALTKDGETITSDMILNSYATNVSAVDLSLYQTQMLDPVSLDNWGFGTTGLDQLFPGWTENGKRVDLDYAPTKRGRHILEPMDCVPIDTDKYLVQWIYDWDDWKFYQTLTAYNGDDKVLEVPEYVQTINFNANHSVNVEKLILPSTVSKIVDNGNLHVHSEYEVSDDNPYYSSLDGALYDKEKTALQHVPYGMEELVVPDSVKTVYIDKDNAIKTLIINAQTKGELPGINYDNLKDAVIVVPSYDMVEAVIRNNGGVLKNNNIVAVKDDTGESDAEYAFRKNIIVNQTKHELSKVMSGSDTIAIPVDLTSVRDGAFKDSGVENIIWSEGGNFTFGAGWADGGTVKNILCYNEADAQKAKAQLEKTGKVNEVSVVIMHQANGYTWYSNDDSRVTLIEVPDSLTEFDGTIIGADGSKIEVNAIAGSAFADNQNLQWVDLPESVDTIGAYAFENCTNLEGLLIGTMDTITIGDGAVDGCTALRFIASNAMTANMQNGYDPELYETAPDGTSIGEFFFVQGGAEGYGNHVKPVSGMTYAVRTIGDNGEKALCGIEGDCQTTILRTQKELSGDLSVSLQGDTPVIGAYAFAHTEGDFTFNGNRFYNTIVGEAAFYDSGLSGELEMLGDSNEIVDEAFRKTKLTNLAIEGVSSLGDYAFAECENLTEATLAASSEFNLYAGSFNGCNKLEKLVFDHAPQLILRDNHLGFQFNYQFYADQEAEQVKIELLDGTSASELIKKWRYAYTGHVTLYGSTSNWQELLSNCWSGEEEAKEELLTAENRIRTMLGMDNVTQPTDLYCHTVDNDGMITLDDVMTDESAISLNAETMEMPDGWYVDYLGTGAFQHSPQITELIDPSELAGMGFDVFSGLGESEDLNVYLTNDNAPPVLQGYSPDAPFTFGMDESRLHIYVISFGGLTEEDYLNAWIYPMAGYADYNDMYNSIAAEFEDGATPEDVHAKMTEILLPIENRLRRILGMEETDELTIPLEQPEIIEPDDQEPPEESGDLTEIDGPGDNTNGNEDIDDDAANEPTDDPEENDSNGDSDDWDASGDSADDPADDSVVLPMEDGVHEIVIPSQPSADTGTDSSTSAEESTEEKGVTE